jgi:hypothetical protein
MGVSDQGDSRISRYSFGEPSTFRTKLAFRDFQQGSAKEQVERWWQPTSS